MYTWSSFSPFSPLSPIHCHFCTIMKSVSNQCQSYTVVAPHRETCRKKTEAMFVCLSNSSLIFYCPHTCMLSTNVGYNIPNSPLYKKASRIVSNTSNCQRQGHIKTWSTITRTGMAVTTVTCDGFHELRTNVDHDIACS